MFAGNSDGRLGVLLRFPRFAAQLMKYRCKEQSLCEPIRFGGLTRQADSVTDPLHGLLRLAEKPERPGRKAAHGNTGVLYVQKRIIGMLRIVERKSFLVMLQSAGKLSHVKIDDLHGPVSSHRETGVRESLRQS